MGSGFIQLLASGNENKLFNYNPNITFFKIYYRRHTNFFINNMLIPGNMVNIDINSSTKNQSNQNQSDQNKIMTSTDITNKIINFNIPSNGDLLTKSYIHLKFEDYAFELFDSINEQYSTLNKSILNVYNSYYIKVNNYSIQDITKISIIKINYFYNKLTKPKFIIMSNIIHFEELNSILNNEPNLNIQKSIDGIFYNCDLINNYYAFDIQINSIFNLKNNHLIEYLYMGINDTKLDYIQLDIPEKNISIRIIYLNKKLYKYLIDILYTDKYFFNILEVRIETNYIFYKCEYSTDLINMIIQMGLMDSLKLELEIIVNKLNSSKIIFDKNIVNKMVSLLENKKNTTTIYLIIFNCYQESQSQMTIMENILYFGNMTNEYYNDLLISDSNDILSIFNTTNNVMSLKLIIKIFVSIFCNNEVSIQEYLKIVNNDSLFYLKNLTYYNKHVEILQEKLIKIFMDPDVLIVSKKAFYLLSYTKNIYRYFDISNYVQPFINKLITPYTKTIILYYLFSGILYGQNKYFNNNVEDFNINVFQLIDAINLNNNMHIFSILNKIYQINYSNNNFMFDLVSNRNNITSEDIINKINYSDVKIFSLMSLIIDNIVKLFISNSLSIISSITNKLSSYIYISDGKLSSLFNNSESSICILPLTSNLLIFSDNLYNECECSSETNNQIFFNKTFNTFTSELIKNTIEYLNYYINKYKVNIQNQDYKISELIQNNNLFPIINNYYNKSILITNELDLNNLNIYLNMINTIDYEYIYGFSSNDTLNLNNEIMYQFFTYVDTNLYNNSFSSHNYYKYTDCNTSSYNTNLKIELNYLKFIFSISSPLYRLYFLFTFLSKFTIDYNYSKIFINSNNSNNNLSDITTLRDLILSFILKYLYLFNSYNININFTSNEFSKYDLDLIDDPNYSLSNNFICCDNIEIINNLDFNNKLRETKSSNFTILYNSFYFLQKNNNNIQLTMENIKNIPNICNDMKYNFDDSIIILFLQVLNTNKDFFINYNIVYDFVLDFFNKYVNDYHNIISSFIKILDSSNPNDNYVKILKTEFYSRCYLSTFSIGVLFDNTNNNNIITINNIYSLLNQKSSFDYNYAYSFKNYNIKQNINYLSISNITNCLNFFETLLFPIFNTNSEINFQHAYNYLNSIQNYTNNNGNYFYLYLITEYSFIESISIINKTIDLYNNVNNSNISLIQNNITTKYTNGNFIKYNFIVIVYYFIYFISECLESDINEYNSNKKNENINFGEYIVFKYKKNIYYDCIEGLVNLFKKYKIDLNFDFSIYYYKKIDNINKNYSNIITKTSNYSKLEYNYVQKNDLITNTEKLTYNSINVSSVIYVNSISNMTDNYIQMSTYFNVYYNDMIYNLMYKINDVLLLSLNNDLSKKSDSIHELMNKSLLTNMDELKNYYYTTSLAVLNESVYTQLLKSFYINMGWIKKNDKNSIGICNLILDILKNYFIPETANYFSSIYYLSNINPINSPELNENLNNLNNTPSLGYFYSKYINLLIINSMKFEKEINRVIYCLCTNYLLSNSVNEELKNKVYSKTLYDSVKLYYLNPNTESNIKQKKYLSNTSIYSDQSIFQIFNYENLMDNISLIQNYWINDIIEKINIKPDEPESYLKKFIEFVDYISVNNLNSNLYLSNGLNVFDYFGLIENYNELTHMIYDYICLKEYFAPIYIFNNIVNLSPCSEISSKLFIDTDHLKKKIVVFLFFHYIILSNIPKLLIDNIEINENIVLEYSIKHDDNFTQIYDVKLKDVLAIKENMKIIEWSIKQIYQMNHLKISDLDKYEFINNYKDIIYIVSQCKNDVSTIPYYNTLFNKFILSYNDVIGNQPIYTNELQSNKFTHTYTNLISNINIIFNNDITNTSHEYNLTFYSLKLLNIKLENIIYDLDNTTNNKIYNTSVFTSNSKLIYSRVQINDFNLVYNLLCLLLGNYGISYPNLSTDINNVLNNLRLGLGPINDVLEYYKGFTSEYKISLNLSPSSDDNPSQKYMEKIYSIENLSKMVNDLSNFSVITPNDYDDMVFINFKYGYKNFFQKYYLYNYNHYNFSDNEKVIFSKLYKYYKNISTNTTAITNIKNTNIYLYMWMFIDLINSFISINYYENKSEPYLYLETLNDLTNLYFKYNYKFTLNPSISSTSNLKIQYEYSQYSNKKTYSSLLDYQIKYYNYKLFSTNEFELTNYKNDILIFFNTLNYDLNTDFYYVNNYYNLVLKFEIIVRYIIYKINKISNTHINTHINTNINTYSNSSYTTFYNIPNIHNDKIILKLKTKLIEYFTNLYEISIFFNIKYILIPELNLTNSSKLFYLIENSINLNEFIKRFSKCIKKIIYWVNKYSYNSNFILIWEEYFKNFNIEYYEYNGNQYKICIYKLTTDDLNFLIYNYLNYIIFKNDGLKNFIKIEIEPIYKELFVYKGEKDKIYLMEPYQINKIILFEDNQSESELNYFSNNTINSVFNNIILSIINTKWGTVKSHDENIISNKKIKSCIWYLNSYFIYIDFLSNVQDNPITNKIVFDFDYYNDLLAELYILYYLILITITCSYINLESNYNLIGKMITNANTYIELGNKIYCMNLINNFSIYMDNLNSNIISNNNITNYYKTIQNKTIYDNINYNIPNFKENINNYDNYMNIIFNQQTNILNLINENDIGSNTFFNIILNTIDNLSTNINYFTDITTITTNLYNILFYSLNKNIERFKKYIGGENKNGIIISESNINNLFDINNFKSELNLINLFSLIFRKSDTGNIVIILLYNMIFITWSTLGINIYEESFLMKKLFYILANLINKNMMEWIEMYNLNMISENNLERFNELNNFFNELNIILFQNYTNDELVETINNFFQKLIYNKIGVLNPDIFINFLSNPIFDTQIKSHQYKINNWLYLLGLSVDYNNTIYTKNFKSILNIYTDVKIQDKILNYIIDINGSLMDKYGIIKIIENMELLFDDLSISIYSGNDYKIFLDNFQNINKQKLINDMLGIPSINTKYSSNILNGIKPYIKQFKSQTFIIPIKFFFEKYFNSIPLITCMYTKINLQLKLINGNIFKNTFTINNLIQPKISTFLDINYILVERDERKNLCKGKIDNLIERNNNFNIVKDIVELKNYKYSIQSNTEEFTKINFDFDLDNLVKQLFWTFELHIDNYIITIVKDYNITNFYIIKEFETNQIKIPNFDFIVNTKFLIDGVRRDGITFTQKKNNNLSTNTTIKSFPKSYNKITTLLNPYKYNTKRLVDNNFNTYSFSLEPADFQPSGALNMSKIKTFTIQIEINLTKLTSFIKNLNILYGLNKVNLSMKLTTSEYNLVRYQSGLAGLLFVI